ncbi:MAG: ABC transporter ATP-binding protein/permease [Candidatus Aminicenantes bacterium]|nr:ABC transporter ATP-binding protein/permease [Candidatus Aminicenantes bacterium]
MKEIFQLFKLTLVQKNRLALSFLFSIFAAFFTYVFVDLVQPIIDQMILKNALQAGGGKLSFLHFLFKRLQTVEEQFIWLIPLLLVVVIFGKGIFTFFASFFMKSIGHKAVKDLRDDLFESLLYQSMDYFDHKPTGELMSRLTSDVDKVQQGVAGSMGDLMLSALMILALMGKIFITDWQLALFSLIITPLAIVPLILFSHQLKKRGLLNQKKMANIYNLLHETIKGNKIVKAFTMEKFEMKKFFQSTFSYFKACLKLEWVGSASSPFMEFVGGILGAFILIVGTSRIARGYMTPGDFSSFIMAIFMMYTPIKRLSRANNTIQQAVASYERTQEVLQSQPQIKEHPGAYSLPPVKGRVEFENVSFSYDNMMPVLHDISFEVKPTERIALVGLSGAGKTTIINLISRFYDPTSGRIIIDGVDIREVSLSSLRSQIGLVTQELILFNDTVSKNIAYGLEDMPLEKIKEAAKAAEAHEFIMELPRNYDSSIGEGGTLLSSGQRQRLAIARALLKNPPILILDEATSALDSESERLIQIALANVMKDRTTFIIAHRLSTIHSADRILVIDKGRIAETGSHEELLRMNGIFRKLYDLQFLEEEAGT